jgi:hypothetical protein
LGTRPFPTPQTTPNMLAPAHVILILFNLFGVFPVLFPEAKAKQCWSCADVLAFAAYLASILACILLHCQLVEIEQEIVILMTGLQQGRIYFQRLKRSKTNLLRIHESTILLLKSIINILGELSMLSLHPTSVITAECVPKMSKIPQHHYTLIRRSE